MRRSYHHGDLRHALLTAAVELLETTSAAELSLREVARKAGVTTGAPYHHFKTKADLLVEVACAGFEALGAELSKLDAKDSPPAERFEARCAAYMRFALAHGAHYRVMFSPELRSSDDLPRYDALARAGFADLVTAVRAMRPELRDAQARSLALSAWAGAHGLVMLALEGAVDALGGRNGASAAAIRATARHLCSMVLSAGERSA